MKLKDWLFKDAEWYEFWLPQSDLIGGMICGAIIGVVVILATYLF